MHLPRRWWRSSPAAVVLAALVLVGCADGAAPPERTTVGFILVGERDDLGYNQAIWEGSEALARAFPEVSVLRVEGVPEDERAVVAMEDLIDEGADILFATSFGHLDAAYDVASRHPDVVVVHQGGVEPDPALDNFGTFFGAHADVLHVAGIAAGAETRTGRLGVVVAFPIAATFNNVNALTLGARTVRPDVETHVVFTGSWCDPAAQRRAYEELRALDVDVVAQHQDCTRTLLELAEADGLASVGFHADGSEVAPDGWLTGAVWSWEDLFVDIVDHILREDFVDGPYDGDFRGSLATRDSPVLLTEPGRRVSPATVALMDERLDRLVAGGSVFEGPIRDRDGAVRVPEGEMLTPEEVDAMDWFVEGVVGDVPAG